MSGFTAESLVGKLFKLSDSQQSIQTLSHWVQYHKKACDESASVWAAEALRAQPNRQLLFVYLGNDVIQSSKRKGEEFVRAYEGIEASDQFEVVRLKNKIGKCEGPFNLHVNVLFHPAECKDPILTEIQFYPKAVSDLQHRQHLAYELKRAGSVQELL